MAAVIKDQLDKGLLDIGILMEPVEVEKYAFIQLPKKDVWGILMPEDEKETKYFTYCKISPIM